MHKIINRQRSIIPACDVEFAQFEKVLIATKDIPEIGAYKIGSVLALSEGLPRIVQTARAYTDKPLIYDHQKAGTDIPDTGKAFAETLKRCGIDAIILFPFSGPETQHAWIRAAQSVGLAVIVGAHMTHGHFLASEGGYIDDAAIEKMLINAAVNNIADYVVPGNKPEVIGRLRRQLSDAGVDPVLYAPGFVAQGGTITSAGEAAGSSWHAIIGRAIYGAKDIRVAALDLARAVQHVERSC
jgi:orotidine-5'-phosphate decarboxylase